MGVWRLFSLIQFSWRQNEKHERNASGLADMHGLLRKQTHGASYGFMLHINDRQGKPKGATGPVCKIRFKPTQMNGGTHPTPDRPT